MTLNTLPDELQEFAGELLDVDSHEMMPAQMWVQEIGPVAERLAQHWLNNDSEPGHLNHPNVVGYNVDDAPIDPATIWLKKGPTAPGATNPKRRLEIMDLMGVKRQLMFPTGVGMFGMLLAHVGVDYGYATDLVEDRKGYGKALVEGYNDWAVKVNTDRARTVAIMFEDTPEALFDRASALIEQGIRAVWLPAGMLPGGRSPAHADLDPVWELFARSKTAVCLHTGVEEDIYASRKWGEASVFEGYRLFDEFKLDPWSRVNNHIMAQNFVATMVVGGVFERHPELRFGVIELGGFWIGPLCDIMDMWFDQDPGGSRFSDNQTFFLPQRPSLYVKRNIRVSPFDFEPVDKYVTQYGLEDVISFATDYPHVEGGKDPVGRWYARLAPLGREVVKKFFVTNGKWLLPD